MRSARVLSGQESSSSKVLRSFFFFFILRSSPSGSSGRAQKPGRVEASGADISGRGERWKSISSLSMYFSFVVPSFLSIDRSSVLVGERLPSLA